MTKFEKIENLIEQTNNINLLRDMLIETISNNEVDIDILYLDHKKEIEKAFNKDNH